MHLLRSWRTRLLGGAALALLVPVAVLGAALAVGLAGGGASGLGQMGQALTGPALPALEPMAAQRAERDPRRLLESSLPGVPDRSRRAPAGRTTASGDGRARPAPRSPAGGRGPGREQPSPPTGPRPSPPADDPEPGPVRVLGDRLKDTTDGVPVAGEPAGRVVDTIVDTVEALPVPAP